jgi:hypothetical protein
MLMPLKGRAKSRPEELLQKHAADGIFALRHFLAH